jgi:DNA-directed RNA polymerase subunit RPC12/RpoP
MVQITRLLECPNCQKQLEDTRQDNVTCRYCGYSFRRVDVVQEDEDYIRRKMIVELRTDMEIFKARKKFSTIFMVISFALAIPLLFSIPFEPLHWVMLGLFLAGGFTFFILMLLWDKRYESSRSQASDISMRRRL